MTQPQVNCQPNYKNPQNPYQGNPIQWGNNSVPNLHAQQFKNGQLPQQFKNAPMGYTTTFTITTTPITSDNNNNNKKSKNKNKTGRTSRLKDKFRRKKKNKKKPNVQTQQQTYVYSFPQSHPPQPQPPPISPLQYSNHNLNHNHNHSHNIHHNNNHNYNNNPNNKPPILPQSYTSPSYISRSNGNSPHPPHPQNGNKRRSAVISGSGSKHNNAFQLSYHPNISHNKRNNNNNYGFNNNNNNINRNGTGMKVPPNSLRSSGNQQYLGNNGNGNGNQDRLSRHGKHRKHSSHNNIPLPSNNQLRSSSAGRNNNIHKRQSSPSIHLKNKIYGNNNHNKSSSIHSKLNNNKSSSAAEALPLGWAKLKDNKGFYYFNVITAQKQRVRPFADATQSIVNRPLPLLKNNNNVNNKQRSGASGANGSGKRQSLTSNLSNNSKLRPMPNKPLPSQSIHKNKHNNLGIHNHNVSLASMPSKPLPKQSNKSKYNPPPNKSNNPYALRAPPSYPRAPTVISDHMSMDEREYRKKNGSLVFAKLIQSQQFGKQNQLQRPANWDMLVDAIYLNLTSMDYLPVFRALRSIAENLFDEDDKYRILYADNKKVQERILLHVGGYEFLRGLGFREISKRKLICDKPDFDIVATAISAINCKLDLLDLQKQNIPLPIIPDYNPNNNNYNPLLPKNNPPQNKKNNLLSPSQQNGNNKSFPAMPKIPSGSQPSPHFHALHHKVNKQFLDRYSSDQPQSHPQMIELKLDKAVANAIKSPTHPQHPSHIGPQSSSGGVLSSNATIAAPHYDDDADDEKKAVLQNTDDLDVNDNNDEGKLDNLRHARKRILSKVTSVNYSDEDDEKQGRIFPVNYNTNNMQTDAGPKEELAYLRKLQKFDNKVSVAKQQHLQSQIDQYQFKRKRSNSWCGSDIEGDQKQKQKQKQKQNNILHINNPANTFKPKYKIKPKYKDQYFRHATFEDVPPKNHQYLNQRNSMNNNNNNNNNNKNTRFRPTTNATAPVSRANNYNNGSMSYNSPNNNDNNNPTNNNNRFQTMIVNVNQQNQSKKKKIPIRGRRKAHTHAELNYGSASATNSPTGNDYVGSPPKKLSCNDIYRDDIENEINNAYINTKKVLRIQDLMEDDDIESLFPDDDDDYNYNANKKQQYNINTDDDDDDDDDLYPKYNINISSNIHSSTGSSNHDRSTFSDGNLNLNKKINIQQIQKQVGNSSSLNGIDENKADQNNNITINIKPINGKKRASSRSGSGSTSKSLKQKTQKIRQSMGAFFDKIKFNSNQRDVYSIQDLQAIAAERRKNKDPNNPDADDDDYWEYYPNSAANPVANNPAADPNNNNINVFNNLNLNKQPIMTQTNMNYSHSVPVPNNNSNASNNNKNDDLNVPDLPPTPAPASLAPVNNKLSSFLVEFSDGEIVSISVSEDILCIDFIALAAQKRGYSSGMSHLYNLSIKDTNDTLMKLPDNSQPVKQLLDRKNNYNLVKPQFLISYKSDK